MSVKRSRMAEVCQRPSSRRWLWLAALVSIVALAVPAIAYAATTENVAQGLPNISGANELWLYTQNSEGYLNRNFVRVYHYAGATWTVFYCDGTTCFDYVTNSSNPTSQGANVSSSTAWCYTAADASGVGFECQTTKP